MYEKVSWKEAGYGLDNVYAPFGYSWLGAAQAQHQNQWIGWRGLKSVVLVKAFGTIMQCVNEQRAHARVLGYMDGTLDGIQ